MRALARKPEARFASSAEMVAALRTAAGIGATTQAQRPATPMGGTPVIGETIVAGSAGPRTPAYVQPQIPTPPPQPRVGQASATPGVGLPPLQSIADTPPSPSVGPAPKPKSGLAIGIGVVVVLLVLAIGGGVALSRRGPGPTPTPLTPDPAIAELITQSDKALAASEIDKALKGYQQVIAKDAHNLPALSGIALAYNIRGDWPQAEASANTLVNAALADDRSAALGLTLLADALISQGSPTDAAEEIKRALDLDKNLSLALAISSTISASEAGDLKDRTLMDQALAEADKAVDSLKDETPVIQALTYNAIAVTFSQDYDLTTNDSSRSESETDYKHAIDLLPEVALFHSNLGSLYSSAKSYDKALAAFKDALDIDPSYAGAQVGIGWNYYSQKQTDKAAAAFDAAIKLNPEEPGGYFGKGRLAYDDDKYAEAITQFQNATKRNPRSAAAQAWLGKAYQFSGFNESDPDKQKQAYASAEAAYRKAIKLNTNYAFAVGGLGWVLQYQENYEDSVNTFQHALELNNQDSEAYNGLGWSQFNLNHYSEAETAFRKAIGIASDYASAHYGLGRALEELGRKDEARTAYQKTLALDPSYSHAQEALDG